MPSVILPRLNDKIAGVIRSTEGMRVCVIVSGDVVRDDNPTP